MLDKAFAERIIHDYKDIFKQATEDRLTSAKELPYFEGDFWPNVLEESIKELEQEEEERKKEESTAASETTEVKPQHPHHCALLESLLAQISVLTAEFWQNGENLCC
ncbi:CREB binding protein [Phyllostomus discolor]|uniref:histone acetyltransferase n=1 Tax=Phyllostomus discolor TaxID=89673 RepID=A0A834B5P4_9CHIR|nr:CREB binding protein [Phyllostomus discolor]